MENMIEWAITTVRLNARHCGCLSQHIKKKWPVELTHCIILSPTSTLPRINQYGEIKHYYPSKMNWTHGLKAGKAFWEIIYSSYRWETDFSTEDVGDIVLSWSESIKHVSVANHISKRMTCLYAVWSWFCLSHGSSSWDVQEERFVHIMHTQVIFPQVSRVVSAWCSRRIGIGIEGCGARSGTISCDLVTRCFVEYNWKVGFFLFLFFEVKFRSLEGFSQEFSKWFHIQTLIWSS